MVASVLMSLVVLAAPTDEEAAKLLRVAWASQYEWKEDGVKNATINFNFEEIRTAGSDDFASGGKGTVVFANGEIARIHAPGVGWRRKVLVEELTWVFQRFARKPFEERFKDAEFKKPEKAAGDTTKIASTKAWGYFLKEGRIVGLEYNIGKGKKPFIVRVDYKPTDMRDGYGLLSEFSSFTMAGVKTVSTRELELRRTDDAPSPKTFVKTTLMAGTKVVFKIEFELPQLNEENPVVLDTVARDALREAWQRRWVLPDDIRLDGMFQRKPDRDLGKAGWMDVSGDFQVWGMNDIKTAVDVKKFRRAGGQVAETCQNQIREGFGRFKATPFDAEFKGCGFTREESKDGKAAVIRLFG
ncbi:MAG: hypothetical protein OER88_10655, partial [Planctomycetota bacterium]|nr:hypothetical protein [Planctomycetota bacterium]